MYIQNCKMCCMFAGLINKNNTDKERITKWLSDLKFIDTTKLSSVPAGHYAQSLNSQLNSVIQLGSELLKKL